MTPSLSRKISQNFYRYSQFKDKLLQLANELGDRAKISNLTARTITLEIKTFEYKTHRRSKTTSEFIGTHKDFIKFGLKLLDERQSICLLSCSKAWTIGLQSNQV